MGAGYDGSIRIDTSIDSKGFNGGIKAMMGSLKGLAAAVGIAFGVGAVLAFGKSSVSAAAEASAALIGLQSILDGTGKSFTEAKKFIDDYIADGLVPLTNAVTAYKNLALRGYDTTQIQKVLIALKDSASFGRQAALTLGQAVQSASEGLKNENSILVDNAGVTKNVAKMWDEYAKSIGTTATALTKQQKIEAEVQGILNETRFQVGDAAKLAGGYSGQVAALGTSFYNLKVALGNTIIPVLSKIIPYVKAVIDWFVVLFNTAARVIGLFFNVDASMASAEATAGGVANETEAAAGAAGELADNTKKAGKAAKGALAAFDDLNVLQMETGSAGSKAGGATGLPGGGINLGDPKEIIPDALRERVEAFKQAMLKFFEPLREPFEHLKKALSELGGTIWDGLQWAFENILVPVGEWLGREFAPRALELLATALDFLNQVLIALKPVGLWLWEHFLKPLGEWTGQAILDFLDWFTEGLAKVTDALEEGGFGAALLASWEYTTGKMEELAGQAWDWIVEQWGKFADWFNEHVTEPVKEWFQQAWEDIKGWAEEAWTNIKGFFTGAGTWFKTNVTEPIASWFKTAWENIKTAAGGAWTAVQDAWRGAGEWIREKVTDPIKNAFKTALDWVKEKWELTFGGVQNFVKGVINKIIDFINAMISGIATGLNTIIGGMNKIKISVPSWVPVYGGQSWGFNLSTVSAPQIPRLASGAVIPPGAEFLAMLGDQRNGRNLEAPEGLIRQIIREEIGEMGGDINVTMPVYLDSQKIYEGQQRVQNRKGPSLVSLKGSAA